MTIATISIITGGILSIGMAIFHSRFPRLFSWERDLESVSAPNQRILFTIHLGLLLTFVVFGALSLTYTAELARCEGLAFGFCLFYAGFWLWRAAWQVYYFKPTNRRHRHLHVLLTIVFFLLFICYAVPPALQIAARAGGSA